MLSDDEIDRAVCGFTPTQSAAPAPNVLREMKHAKRRELLAWLARRAMRTVDSCALVIGYFVMLLAVAALVVEVVRP